MAKYILLYKIQQEKARSIILCNTPYNTNYFPAILKAKTILELTQKSNYKSLYLANLDKKYPGDNNENTEILDIKYIISISDSFINQYTTFTQLRSGI